MRERSWLTILCIVLFAASEAPAAAVVGGKAARIEAAPWTVAVLSPYPTLARPRLCTGVIIDAVHVVTAGHCIPRVPRKLTVLAGVSDFIKPARGERLQKRLVASFRVLSDSAYADVAVLTMARPLKLDGVHLRAIAITRANIFRGKQAGLLAGFGQAHGDTTPSGQLRQIRERVDSQGTCGFLSLHGAQAALWICGQAASGGSCFGDSGGGLVSTGIHPVLLGIFWRALAVTSSACAPGEVDQYTYVGAPEVWRFIHGDDGPPLAPRDFFVNDGFLDPLRVGDPVFCDATGARGYRVRYTLSIEGRLVRFSDKSITYRVRRADTGKRFRCTGSATNGGGTSFQSVTSAKVTP